jgi:carbonic anhydrase
MSSPTQRSLAKLRADGWLADVVEKWIPMARVRKDLWGFVDILCLRGKEILAVQTTTDSNVSARVNKITNHENVDAVRKAGIAIVVHGWKRVKGRWQVRVVDVS